MLSRFLLLAFALTSPGLASAQQPKQSFPADAVLSVSLKDGTILVGRITEEDVEQLTMQTLLGLTVRVPRSAIVSIREAAVPTAAGRFTRPDPNYSRLMFAPTARPLRKGDGYFSDH